MAVTVAGRMKRIGTTTWLVVISVVIGCSGGGADPTTTRVQGGPVVTLAPGWQVGDKYAVTSQTEIQVWSNSELFSTDRSGSRAEFEIQEARPDGFLVIWSTTIDGRATSDYFRRAFTELELEIELGPDGSITGLRNWMEVRSAVDRSLLELVATSVLSGQSTDKIAQISEVFVALSELVSNEESIINGLNEQGLLFSDWFRTYEVGVPVAIDDTTESYSGVPIVAEQSIVLREYDPAENNGTVTIEISSDVSQIIDEVVDLLPYLPESRQFLIEEDVTVELTGSVEAKVNFRRGVVESIESELTSSVEVGGQPWFSVILTMTMSTARIAAVGTP